MVPEVQQTKTGKPQGFNFWSIKRFHYVSDTASGTEDRAGSGVLRGRGRQTGLAFVKLDLGARDVNADGPSFPWMHPGAGKVL